MRLGDGNIIGNETVCQRLYEDIQAGTLAHAFIIEGKPGSGKHTLAQNIVAALACSGTETLPCGACKNCRDIFEGKCPDVSVIGREGKASLGIEAIRTLKSTLLVFPNNLELKAYILEDADTMTVQAQNAFLLSLEQPPTNAYFFLLCENARLLLETIRSRCQILRTDLLSCADIAEFLCSSRVAPAVSRTAKSLQAQAPEEFDALLLAANGSIGRAIELLSPKTRKPMDDSRAMALRFIEALQRRGYDASVLSLLNVFPSKREDLLFLLSHIQALLRDLILVKKYDEATLCFYTNREAALDTAERFREKQLLSFYDRVENAANALQKNANVKLTLTDLLTSF